MGLLRSVLVWNVLFLRAGRCCLANDQDRPDGDQLSIQQQPKKSPLCLLSNCFAAAVPVPKEEEEEQVHHHLTFCSKRPAKQGTMGEHPIGVDMYINACVTWHPAGFCASERPDVTRKGHRIKNLIFLLLPLARTASNGFPPSFPATSIRDREVKGRERWPRSDKFSCRRRCRRRRSEEGRGRDRTSRVDERCVHTLSLSHRGEKPTIFLSTQFLIS